MEFFEKIFDGLTELATKLPAAPVGAYFLVVLLGIAVAAALVGLSFLGSRAGKLKSACRRIIAYLDDESSVGEDNVADFTAECFGAKVPAPLREAWVQFVGVRFGYPSEIVSESGVFDKIVRRNVSIRASIFIAVALILTAFFAFWGLGSMGTAAVGVALCLGLLLSAIGYIVLVVAGRKQYMTALSMFREMQDMLDAKVDLQAERDYSVDVAPLTEIAAVIDGIVSRNSARPAPELDPTAGEENEEPGKGDAPGESEEGAEPASTAEEETAAEEAPEGEASGEETPLEEVAEEDGIVVLPPLSEESGDAVSPEEGGAVPLDETSESGDAGEAGFSPLGRYGGGLAYELTPLELAAEAAENDAHRSPTSEEINREYEVAMFGRKKKQQQAQAQAAAAAAPQPVDYDNMMVESELIEDDGEDYVLVRPGVRPASLEGLNIAVHPAAESSVTVSLEPEVVYVEENLDEGDEEVKAPRLAKMPHLVDYVLTMKLSRSMKIRVAMLMLQAYNVFKNSPENKAIVIQCLTKIIQSIMADRAAEKAAAEKAAAEAAAAAGEAAADNADAAPAEA